MCVFIYGCIYAWSGQTKNDTDLEFGTHTPIELIKKWFICFFDQITVMASSLEKLPCHMGFSHISSIALFSFLLTISFFNESSQLWCRRLGKGNTGICMSGLGSYVFFFGGGGWFDHCIALIIVLTAYAYCLKDKTCPFEALMNNAPNLLAICLCSALLPVQNSKHPA